MTVAIAEHFFVSNAESICSLANSEPLKAFFLALSITAAHCLDPKGSKGKGGLGVVIQ